MGAARDQLADRLEQALAGNGKVEAVLNESSFFEGELAGCNHGLQHFVADQDIRERDTAYRNMQESEMRKLISLLRSGADAAALAKVHFLGESGWLGCKPLGSAPGETELAPKRSESVFLADVPSVRLARNAHNEEIRQVARDAASKNFTVVPRL